MKAIVQERYGSPDALTLQEIAPPTVGDDEVEIRVRAASVHPDVWHVIRGVPYVLRLMGSGVRRPRQRVPGTDVAGHVESVGRNVTRFRPGDAVYGETVQGYQWTHGGAYAEFVSAPEAGLASKPDGTSFEQAAAVPTSGLIALHALRREGAVRPGQRVLINGAGGGVGTFAVQLAKAFGAHVTAVDHGHKLARIQALGADRVIDFTREDFTRGDERFDVVLDVPGNHPFAAIRRVLAPEGRYVLIGHDAFGADGRLVLGSLPRFLGLMARSPFVPQLPKPNFSLPPKREAMALLTDLLENGTITPAVDRTFPLREVPAAIRYLQEGRACGKVVITVPEG